MIWLSVVRPSLFSNPIRINQTVSLSIFANHSFRTTSTVRRSLSSSWAARKQMLLPRRAQRMNFEQWSYCSTRAFDKRARQRERLMSTIKTLGEFMTDCARTTHRLSCYTPLPSHAAQVSASLSVSRSFSHPVKGYLISFLVEQCRMLISFFFALE